MSTLQYSQINPSNQLQLSKQRSYEKIISIHSKSFSFASKLLPKHVRQDAIILYAWCRYVDDEIDCAVDPQVNLDRLQKELDKVYSDSAIDDPILQDLRKVLKKHNIPKHYPQELLHGMKMDLHKKTYDSTFELLKYCYRVAGTVGLMMGHIMGVKNPIALTQAAQMGMAMQLTNICRDVFEDWERNRMYLPKSFLTSKMYHFSANALYSPMNSKQAEALSNVLPHVLHIADQYYTSGNKGLLYLNVRCAYAISTAKHIYAAIGDELEKKNFNVLQGRAFVSLQKKISLMGISTIKTLFSIPLRIFKYFSHSNQKLRSENKIVAFQETIIDRKNHDQS